MFARLFPNPSRQRVRFTSASLLVSALLGGCTLDAQGSAGTAETDRDPTTVDASGEPSLDAGAVPDAALAQHDGNVPELDAELTGDARMPEPAEPDAALEAGADSAVADAGDDAAAREDAATDDGGEAGTEPDADLDASLSVDASASDAAAPSACLREGSYALLVDQDVSWEGKSLAGVVPLLRAGRGRVRVWLELDLSRDGTSLRSRLRSCGAALPDFAAMNPRIGTELYAAYIPDSSWEAPSMPRWDVAWSEGACLEPGCAVASEPLVATLGARIEGDSVWPGEDGPLDQLMLVDHDGDGQPGVTLVNRTPAEQSASGIPYIEPPLSWSATPRSRELYMALQVTYRLEGAVRTCEELGGDVYDGRVENRVLSCTTRPAEGAEAATCTPAHARFMDRNLPEWTVTGGRWRMQYLGDEASCSDVRAALR